MGMIKNGNALNRVFCGESKYINIQKMGSTDTAPRLKFTWIDSNCAPKYAFNRKIHDANTCFYYVQYRGAALYCPSV